MKVNFPNSVHRNGFETNNIDKFCRRGNKLIVKQRNYENSDFITTEVLFNTESEASEAVDKLKIGWRN